MASTTSLSFNKSSKNPTLPTRGGGTSHQPDHRPNSTTTNRPDPGPKTRARKGARVQKAGPNKVTQRGMGVERLELEIRRQNGSSPTPRILAAKLLANHNIPNISNIITNTNNGNGNGNGNSQYHQYPLAGVPVNPYPLALTQYFYSGQPGPSSIRAASMASEAGFGASELPSMPNLLEPSTYNNNNSYKKKRVIEEEEEEEEENEEVVGFGKGKEKQQDFVDYDDQSLMMMSNNYYNNNNVNYHGMNFGGFNVNNNNNNNNNNNIGDYHQQLFGGNNNNNNNNNVGVYPNYYDHNNVSTGSGSEVVAIHPKWSKSNVMMEYGFFPRNSGSANENDQNTTIPITITNNNNNNDNYYYKSMDYSLDLKIGCSDYSSSSSPSSSLTTATNTSTNNNNNAAAHVVSDTCNLDLSLTL